jgi:hypothetical protein
MVLSQKNYPTETPQDLPAHDDVVDTGAMGGCSCVLFFWQPDGTGRYANVRGYHGGGGLHAVNWTAMRAGVPNHQSTLALVIASPENGSLAERKRAKDFIKSEILQYLPLAHCTTYQGVAQATIDRKGKVNIISFIDLKTPTQTWGT